MAAAKIFYEDDAKEVIKELLLTGGAEGWAEKFLHPSDRNDRPLSASQIRRFYNDVKTLERSVNENNFPKFKPKIKMLISKAAYARRQGMSKESKIPQEFEKFLKDYVSAVEDFKDFKALCLTFESVVGFFYGKGGR